MLEGKLIICDSNIPWHHNRYSKHHLMAQLAKTNEVVFVDPEEGWRQYLRRPRTQRGTLGRRWWYPKGEALTVFTPLRLPGRERLGFLQRWDERYYIRQIRQVIRRYPGRDLILFTGNAWHVFLLDAFPEAACTIYHCSDNFPAMFEGGFREAFERREAELIRRADLVVCSHPSLVEKCRALGGNAHYLEHAVDERFFRPEGEVECPPDLAEVPRPRVGFVGSLDRGLDYDLLREAMRQTPQLSWVLIGPAAAEQEATVRELVALPNVWYLGPRSWENLPPYLWALDVGVLPYRAGEVSAARCPLKLYEYLAAGLQVVARGVELSGLLRVRAEQVEGAEGFASAILGAAHRGSERGADVVAAIREQYTWTRRAEQLSALITCPAAQTGAAANPRPQFPAGPSRRGRNSATPC